MSSKFAPMLHKVLAGLDIYPRLANGIGYRLGRDAQISWTADLFVPIAA
jgi:hypothetical protein